MASPDVNTPGEHLWNYTRLKPEVSLMEWLMLLAWAPVGLTLCLLRVVAWPIGIVSYPIAHAFGAGRQYMRFVQPLWACKVTIKGQANLDQSTAPIIVANHVSDFDACAIWGANPPAEQRLVVNDHWRPVISAARRLGWPIDPIFTSGGDTKQALTDEVASLKGATGRPKRILLFPEGRTSSGISVMPFFDFTFSLGVPVVPCAVRVRNPWPVQMQMNGTSVLNNLAAMYFLPFVGYELTFLPEVSGQGMSKEDYSEAVRGQLLKHLGVPPTKLTAKDKVAFGRARAESRKAA